MSTPGPERVPSTVKAGTTSGQGNKPPAGKSGGGSPRPGSRPVGKGGKGGKGRKTFAPVKTGPSWGPILITGLVVVLAVGIIGFGVYSSMKQDKKNGTPWAERAAAISGIVNFRETDKELVKGSNHQDGTLTYQQNPPVAGPHNARWQNCNGNVYDAPIANEHAVHSLEHGAVWITYKQGLAADQVETLTDKVEGREKTFISPVASLDTNISLQAWGYQLKVDSADDPRIDEFIQSLRVNASIEGPTALCDGGVTATGTTPQVAAG